MEDGFKLLPTYLERYESIQVCTHRTTCIYIFFCMTHSAYLSLGAVRLLASSSESAARVDVKESKLRSEAEALAEGDPAVPVCSFSVRPNFEFFFRAHSV